MKDKGIQPDNQVKHLAPSVPWLQTLCKSTYRNEIKHTKDLKKNAYFYLDNTKHARIIGDIFFKQQTDYIHIIYKLTNR